ncbi:helix-turn-helix domain-containing protein [Pandoraea norimbergensis]|nr:helix-turn-helix domain-containing protein [Pandoraea norimbergensis]
MTDGLRKTLRQYPQYRLLDTAIDKAIAALARETSGVADSSHTADAPVLALAQLALLTLVRLQDMIGTSVSTPPAIHLTPRETECLQWAAAGKTAWETSRILAISERTATFHLTNAVKKLGATNRRAAVARAIGLGLIAP